MAKLLNTMAKIKILAPSEKDKFFDSSIACILTEHLERLYQIDTEKGYDPNYIICREIALQTMTRK